MVLLVSEVGVDVWFSLGCKEEPFVGVQAAIAGNKALSYIWKLFKIKIINLPVIARPNVDNPVDKVCKTPPGRWINRGEARPGPGSTYRSAGSG